MHINNTLRVFVLRMLCYNLSVMFEMKLIGIHNNTIINNIIEKQILSRKDRMDVVR